MGDAMWSCPKCGRSFANRSQAHTCGPLRNLDEAFAGTDPVVRELFDRIVAEVWPVTVLPEKTRIALALRMSFAAFIPRRHQLDGHLVLPREADHRLFRRVEALSRRNVVHRFRLTDPAELDDSFLELLHGARAVGEQRHLG